MVDCLKKKREETTKEVKDDPMEIGATDSILNRDNRPRLPVSVNKDQSYLTLLDHGSMKSYIKKEIIDLLGIKIDSSTFQFKGISGGNFEVLGQVKLALVLPSLALSVKHMVNLFVAENMNHDLLFGIDVIKQIGLIVDPVKEIVFWKDRECHYTTSSIPELKLENSFDVLEVSQFSDEAVRDAVNRSHLTYPKDKTRLYNILNKYADAVKETPNTVNNFKFKNERTEKVPFHRSAPYGVPVKMFKKAKNLIQELINYGTIYKVEDPSKLKCCCSGFFVWKHAPEETALEDRKLQLEANLNHINKFLKRGFVHLPKIEALLARVEKNMLFTSIDFTGDFHQLLLDLEFSLYTAFCLPWGIYAYRKMPMGLSTSPEAFQQYMESILGYLEWLLIYIDDLLIMARDIIEGLDRLEEVLVVLSRHNVKVNLRKSYFLVTELQYLGFVLNQLGIGPNPEKIGPLMNMPIPKTVKDIRSQAGALSFYRKFVPNLASLLAPLTGLTAKNVTFEVTNEMISNLIEARQRLAKCTLLYYPDYSKDFHVQVDASDYGLGGHVFQLDANNVAYPVYFYSRKFFSQQTRYTVIEKEALAVVSLLEHLKNMLYGAVIFLLKHNLNLEKFFLIFSILFQVQ